MHATAMAPTAQSHEGFGSTASGHPQAAPRNLTGWHLPADVAPALGAHPPRVEVASAAMQDGPSRRGLASYQAPVQEGQKDKEYTDDAETDMCDRGNVMRLVGAAEVASMDLSYSRHLQDAEGNIGLMAPGIMTKTWSQKDATKERPPPRSSAGLFDFDALSDLDEESQPPPTWRVLATAGAEVQLRKDLRSPVIGRKVAGSLFLGHQEGEWVALLETQGYIKITSPMTRAVLVEVCADRLELAVRGAHGHHAFAVNGVYLQTGLLLHNRDLFKKKGARDKWFAYMAGRWYVCSTQQKDANSAGGWLRADKVGAQLPSDVESWRAWTGSAWVPQESVTVMPRPRSEASADTTAEEAAVPSSTGTDGEQEAQDQNGSSYGYTWTSRLPPHGGRCGGNIPRAKEGPEPEPATDPELEALRKQCSQVGLCVDWCVDVGALEAMLKVVRGWSLYGVCALKDECGRWGVPLDGFLERKQILERMCLFVAWTHMSVQQLQSECRRRGIPFFTHAPASNLVTLEGAAGASEADERRDLLSRLRQDSFPGTSGPLPAHGIQGVWRPAGSGSAASLRPAWTGAPAPGVRRAEPRAGGSEARGPGAEAPRGAPGGQSGRREGHLGPRARKFMPEFPGFCGAPPGPEAEAAWSDEEIRTYLFSNGEMRPRDRPPAWTWQNEPPPTQPTPPRHQPSSPPASPGASGNDGAGRMSVQRQTELEHYAVLGLAPGASADMVRKAFRTLALRYHPDKQGLGNAADGALEFRRVAEAYDSLRLGFRMC